MLLPAIPEAHFTLWGAEAAGVVCPINYLLDAAHVAELIDAARANIVVALGPNPELEVWPTLAGIAERPAMPKRIDLVDPLPMTAIGKVYKPALRARACERVLDERVRQAGLGGQVGVKVSEVPSGLAVRFEIGPGRGHEAARETLARLMQPFAGLCRGAGAACLTRDGFR